MSRARNLSKLGNENVLSVSSDNNVGINSTSPVEKLNVVGVISATSFAGDGSSLTGIDATALKDSGGNTKVQANSSGAVITGVVTATSFAGSGASLTDIESGVSNFVASGSIDNGDTVVINTDGTVGVVTATGSQDPSVGNLATFDTNNIEYITGTAYDSTNNKVIIAYTHDSDDYGRVVVGTVSGSSITFGSAIVFNSAFTYRPQVTFVGGGKVVVSYSADDGNYTYRVHGKVGTVSGNSVSFGSAAVSDSTNAYEIRAAYDSANDRLAIAYVDSNNSNDQKVLIGTVSGTSLSFGSSVTASSGNTSNQVIVYDSTNEKIVVGYKDGSSGGKIRVGTVSGSSISFGTEATFTSTSSFAFVNGAFVGNGKIVIVFRDNNNSNAGTAVVGTVSGTDISFGSPVVYDAAQSDFNNIQYLPNSNKIVVAYKDVGNSNYLTIRNGTVSGTTVTFDSYSLVTSMATINNVMSSAYDSTTQQVILTFEDSSDVSGKAIVVNPYSYSSNLTSENYVGIAAEDISNGATGKITVVGGVNAGQTGLTTARTHYVQASGGIGLTASSPSVVAGLSISASKILVK
jgi:hypothetical protein|tara:strand:- start:1859 stop:3580 length:1722 start_codon:yes stop_codon:yes gene_type:complete